MRLVFFGTPEFSVPTLAALVDAARAHMAVEVTVGALRCAERPMHVDPEARAIRIDHLSRRHIGITPP